MKSLSACCLDYQLDFSCGDNMGRREDGMCIWGGFAWDGSKASLSPAKAMSESCVYINTTPVNLTWEQGILFPCQTISIIEHLISLLISSNPGRWSFPLDDWQWPLISYGSFLFFSCVKPPTRDSSETRGGAVQAPPGRYTWEEACGHQYVGERMKESDYVKLLMDLEGIVIKVLTLSQEQFGKGMFHTL